MPKVEYHLSIYTFHIDFMRHVSNIVYIQWMEVGRSLLLKAVGLPVEDVASLGFGPVLVETMISYKKPLYLGDSVIAQVWLSELSNASAWLDFRFYNQSGELTSVGRQRGLFIDFASGKPKRLSVDDRSRFEPFLIREKD